MKAAAFLAVIVIVLGLPVSNGSDDPLFGEKALIEIKTVIIQLFKCSVKLVFKFIRLEETKPSGSEFYVAGSFSVSCNSTQTNCSFSAIVYKKPGPFFSTIHVRKFDAACPFGNISYPKPITTTPVAITTTPEDDITTTPGDDTTTTEAR